MDPSRDSWHASECCLRIFAHKKHTRKTQNAETAKPQRIAVVDMMRSTAWLRRNSGRGTHTQHETGTWLFLAWELDKHNAPMCGIDDGAYAAWSFEFSAFDTLRKHGFIVFGTWLSRTKCCTFYPSSVMIRIRLIRIRDSFACISVKKTKKLIRQAPANIPNY